VLLRSMMQAVYATENVGHFGLSFPAYAHFTSPIRRYPDLMVHRALKHLIADGKPDDFEYSPHELVNLGEHCSMTERRADEATRDAADALKCEFMLDKVGQTFEGRIVTVTGFGLFVELADIYITGLVHITALDKDFFHFDPVHHKLSGERTGKVYRLADTIEVTVAAVNLDDRKIDLVLAGAKLGAERPPRGKPKGRGRARGKRRERGRRGAPREEHLMRIEEPDEQPAEHPAVVETPAAETEPPAGERPGGRERGKARREKRPAKAKAKTRRRVREVPDILKPVAAAEPQREQPGSVGRKKAAEKAGKKTAASKRRRSGKPKAPKA
jgi:ribonuclease R